MSTKAGLRPRRKQASILLWLGGGFLLLLILFSVQLLGPNPGIVVSPQTTHIASPLAADGLPDYEQYILESSRKGVTPENNAAALLWTALWPGELDPPQYGAVAKELGLAGIPSGKDSLVSPDGKAYLDPMTAWLRSQLGGANKRPASPDGTDEGGPEVSEPDPFPDAAGNLLMNAASRPWTSKQIPPLAEWPAENEKAMAMIVQASTRPRCYLPSPTLLNGKSDGLIEMLLPGVQSVRAAGRALCVRAMWHTGEGRFDEAWTDLLAAHRIGRLVAQGNTLVEQLVGMAIDGIARDGALALLDQRALTANQARRILSDLDSLSEFNRCADCMDSTERLSYLDAVIQLTARKNTSLLRGMPIGDAFKYLSFTRVNWNVALESGNEFYDRLTKAARLPEYHARTQAFLQIEHDIEQLAAELRDPVTLAAGIINPARRSDVAAAVMIATFLPAVQATISAEDRANTMLELERLAAALAVYRAEHDAYPEQLESLVPGVLKKLPVDLYHAKPFIYKRTSDGYLLYSAGENGIDDGGSNEVRQAYEGQDTSDLDNDAAEKLREKIPKGADDHSVRLPRPAFTLPKIPPANAESQ